MLYTFPGMTHLAKEQCDEERNGSEILILCHQAIGLELYLIWKRRSFWNLPYSSIRAEKGGAYNKKMAHSFALESTFRGIGIFPLGWNPTNTKFKGSPLFG
jgi:hypothetical protein